MVLLPVLVPPLCWSCGAAAVRHQPLCRLCLSRLRWLGADAARAGGIAVWAPLAYEGPARALVRGLKFRGAVALAAHMAAAVAARAPEEIVAAPAALVPVPLHPARRRRRGFNQAERLAAALVPRLGLPLDDCLKRSGASGSQVGRGRGERLSGIFGAVSLRSGRSPPARAVLVDDVMTTGATLVASAHALREAGTAEVAALVYARTPGR